MKCILCGSDMEPGGIITSGVSVMWLPLHEFQKKGLFKLTYEGGKSIGHSNLISGQTRISNAYFCRNCNKIIGVFDVNRSLGY